MPLKRPPLPRVIAVDVDDTLIENGVLNMRLVGWIKGKRADGFAVYLWSMRGERYARRAAEKFGVVELFDYIISKPGCVVDDKGLAWMRDVKVVGRK